MKLDVVRVSKPEEVNLILGQSPKGVEEDPDVEDRRELLRRIGYKR